MLPHGEKIDFASSHLTGQQSGDGGFRIRTDLPLNQDGTGFNYTAGQTYQSKKLCW